MFPLLAAKCNGVSPRLLKELPVARSHSRSSRAVSRWPPFAALWIGSASLASRAHGDMLFSRRSRAMSQWPCSAAA